MTVQQGRSPRFKLTLLTDIAVQLTGRYLIKGLLPGRGLVIEWGPPKSGKSFVSTDIALHIAYGLMYRGRRTAQATVVYICAEGASGFGARLTAWRTQNSVDESIVPAFYVLPERLDLANQGQILVEDIKAQVPSRPGLVVIDTLNRTFSGSESNDQDMTAYVTAADAIIQAFDCCVLVVHHCGIDGTRPRGHTSLTGAADAQIAISRDKTSGIINAKVEWMKDGPEDFDSNSRLEVVEVGQDEDGDPVTSCVIVPTDDQAAPATRRRALSPAHTIALAALADAITTAGEPGPASSQIPSGVRVVRLSLWRDYAYARNSDGSPEAKKKAFQRSREALQSKGFIGVWNDLVWQVSNDNRG
jgi:hypothetical protein